MTISFALEALSFRLGSSFGFLRGMDKTIPDLFAMLKAAEVEIKEEHQVLMVNKTTSFKKKGKGNKKGNFNKNGKQVAAQEKKPKSGPKPKTECFYCGSPKPCKQCN